MRIFFLPQNHSLWQPVTSENRQPHGLTSLYWKRRRQWGHHIPMLLHLNMLNQYILYIIKFQNRSRKIHLLDLKTEERSTRKSNYNRVAVRNLVSFANFDKRARSWEKLFLTYANNKGADQPAHPRSLISTFVASCLDSIISLVSLSKISSLLPCFFGCAGRFVSNLVENPEDRCSRDEAQEIRASAGWNLTLMPQRLKRSRSRWAASRENVCSEIVEQVRFKLACSATKAN